MIDFDILLDKLGHIGKFQWLIFFSLSYWNITNGFNALATVFIAYTPDFRCKAGSFDNSTLYPNLTEIEILNLTTPYNEKDGKYDVCARYGYNISECDKNYSCVNKSAAIISCDKGYHYDDSVFTETVITEFDLVCDRNLYNALSTSLYYVGMLIGSLVFGAFCDRYGRKKTVILCYIGSITFMFGITFSTNVTMYMIFRLICSAFVYGCGTGCYVYIMETVGDKWRTILGFAYQSFFCFGYMMQSGLSYQWRNWHDLMLACCIASLPFIVTLFVVPESPRWLFTNDKFEEGKKVIAQMEKTNNIHLTEKDWEDAEVEKVKVINNYSLLDLFKLPKTRLVTLNMMFSWFVCSLVYYGLALNAGSLAGDIFVNNTLNGVVEISAYVVCIFLLNIIGRRMTLALTTLLAGFGLLVSLISEQYANDQKSLKTVSIVFAFIGKAGISGAFGVIYNLTAELFPTVTRSNAVGMGSAAARIGGILAPFIIWLQDTIDWLPNVIFTVLGITAGLLALLFPETKGFELMETVEEAEHFYTTKTQNKKLNTISGDSTSIYGSEYFDIENKAFSDSSSNLSTEK